VALESAMSVHAVIKWRWTKLVVVAEAKGHERRPDFPARDTAAAGRDDRRANGSACCYTQLNVR